MEVDPRVSKQLNDCVTIIASMYRDNAFHSFEHASHVSMSAVKLLSRVVGPLSKRSRGVGITKETSMRTNLNTVGLTSALEHMKVVQGVAKIEPVAPNTSDVLDTSKGRVERLRSGTLQRRLARGRHPELGIGKSATS